MHDDNLVGALDSRKAVGDDHRRAAFDHAVERVAHPHLSLRVHARSSFVQDQNFGVVRQRPGKRDELFLSGREGRAALADFFLEPLRQRPDELGKVHIFGSFFDLFVGNRFRAQANVAFDRAGKQKWILQNHAVTPAKIGEVHLFYVDPVDFDRALLHVVETHE